MLNDTSRDAMRVQAEVLRRMSPREKLAALGQLYRFAHQLTLAGLRERMPNATPAEIEFEHFRLVLGRELAAAVFAHRQRVGWRPGAIEVQ